MKIILVGMNYALHNKEMGRETNNSEPIVFMKPDTAFLKNGRPFFIPDFTEELQYETEIIVRIERLGKNIEERFAGRYYNHATVGIDFTARDLQRQLRSEGMPWEISKSFDYSAAVGDFVRLDEIGGEIQNLSFRLDINGHTVQSGNTADMTFSVNSIIAYASRFFTLRMGDLIFTGTPAGVGPVKKGDSLEGYIGDRKLLDIKIK
ncbi:MAG: fumarylacetoacetate hydrolase family protein [Tannerellaceae bacterium]|nr:fumarylacetoacetate hydrolase family protein [Tannerellaceae bacterium]